jgi:hypothetical protein
MVSRARPEDLALAGAVADVALAARGVVVDRIELLRLQARNDARDLVSAMAVGGLALVSVSIAAASAAAAIVIGLSLWIGLTAAMTVVAVVALGAGGALAKLARARLPERTLEVRAIEAGDA